jgi:hypothetical protein
LLAELGRVEEALERAAGLAAALEAQGVTHLLVELRSVELASRLARGNQERSGEAADWLVVASRASGAADLVVIAFPPAAAAQVAIEAPEHASALLDELHAAPGTETPYYARQLALMVRTSLSVGDPTLAERLTQKLERRYPLDEHAVCAARAQLAEHAGELDEAAALYAESARRWQEFGNVPERAYALLGQGRCLRALGRPGAEEPLLEARELFASMGYAPMVAEADGLLRPTQFVPAS